MIGSGDYQCAGQQFQQSIVLFCKFALHQGYKQKNDRREQWIFLFLQIGCNSLEIMGDRPSIQILVEFVQDFTFELILFYSSKKLNGVFYSFLFVPQRTQIIILTDGLKSKRIIKFIIKNVKIKMTLTNGLFHFAPIIQFFMSSKINNYFSILPGNNSIAIQRALQKRGVWKELPPEKDYLTASFHWQQLNYPHKIYEEFNELSKIYTNKHYLLNHFENNHVITTKSGLIKTLKYFYSHEGAPLSKHIFEAIPTSFIVQAHKQTTQLKDFKEKFEQIEKKQFVKEKIPQKHLEKNIWFIKPESDNQGKGIILSNNWKDIQSFLISKPVASSWIVQKAIERPLLYNDRKFDVRVWVLVTPHFQVYYYNLPYMRTSSTIYTLENFSSQIHLTNNCQQKHFSEYSKYEEGNTLPFSNLRDYLLEKPEYKDSADLIMDKIIARMKEMIIDTMNCAKKHFLKNSRKNQFELFGYDFLIDEDFRTWILEINNNPYIGTPNKFIKGLLPLMIDQMLQIIVDPFYPPENYTPVATKGFQLLSKERTNFRVVNITSRNSTTHSIQFRKDDDRDAMIYHKKIDLFSIDKSSNKARASFIQTKHFNSVNTEKSQNPTPNGKQKFRYTTPVQNLKYLLQNYCYVDLDPFVTPVALILNSEKLLDEALLEKNIRTLKLISQTRVASILLEDKFFNICQKIIYSKQYNQKIKAQIIRGYENAAKNFKGKLFILQKIIPIVSDFLNREIQQVSEYLIEYIMKLQIKLGGFIQKVFIPGVTSQNERLRKLFIKSNCFSLLLYLSRTYPHLCVEELKNFMINLTHQDWDLFYDLSKNKGKRAYSPRSVSMLMKEKDSSFNIKLHEIKTYSEEKEDKFYESKPTSKAKQSKSFRTRRHSAFPLLKN